MKTHKKWSIIYLIAFTVMIFLNYWSATNVGNIANQDPALIQPAGYAFSIWGPIYLVTFIWLIRLFVKAKKGKQIVDTLGILPVINFLLNGAWIISFTQEWILLSTIVIALLLVNLVSIYTRLSRLNDRHWFDRLPFSMYFAWITVATIVNIFTWFISTGIASFLGLSELSWTNILLVVATLIMGFISLKYKDMVYPLVFVWSFIGILVANQFTYSSLGLILVLCLIAQLACVAFLGKKIFLK
ncbi:tryptophan-rich sensory protein [Aerococcaceae bacterium 50-4]